MIINPKNKKTAYNYNYMQFSYMLSEELKKTFGKHSLSRSTAKSTNNDEGNNKNREDNK